MCIGCVFLPLMYICRAVYKTCIVYTSYLFFFNTISISVQMIYKFEMMILNKQYSHQNNCIYHRRAIHVLTSVWTVVSIWNYHQEHMWYGFRYRVCIDWCIYVVKACLISQLDWVAEVSLQLAAAWIVCVRVSSSVLPGFNTVTAWRELWY